MADRINYRNLLKKYIKHIKDIEGVTYLDDHSRHDYLTDSKNFTDQDWEALKRLELEVHTGPLVFAVFYDGLDEDNLMMLPHWTEDAAVSLAESSSRNIVMEVYLYDIVGR